VGMTVVRYGLTLAATACAVALVVTLLHIGVPVWCLLLIGAIVFGVPAARLWYLRLEAREIEQETARLAAKREQFTPPANDAELPQSRY
jgi:hypothetical protein